ncbi:uncharacterized protein LOC106880676 isoform X1 [Octopus bimaculoides]|uniref:Schlafen AlbA-2 domain-containing protein n=2 Tax=Octopus bimaculoides TaxID=37653 RepID=A0A0L8FWW7_OCTBM|nr:uncharacterized protein LOC106880676 isoform X1 [Octopus bimaculoides]|eukprot:XP_014786216.1 PREDICTED: uncharacterized protein LOC106880676 isoform X1 [Octopus bimaculoides]
MHCKFKLLSQIMNEYVDFYWENNMIPFEEDSRHEFKCHRNLSVEELPPWTQENQKRTRRSISRTLNAFLNTGQGGSVYLGVADDGTIIGLQLTLFQRDHLKVNLDNLMKRYIPQVDVKRYGVHFMPVISQTVSMADAYRICSKINLESETFPKEERQRSHLCQSYAKCWCDEHACMMVKADEVIHRFVIAIHIKPWDPDTMIWNNIVPGINLHPLHANEEGRVFMKTLAGVKLCDDQDIINITVKDVKQIFQTRIKNIKKKIEALKTDN